MAGLVQNAIDVGNTNNVYGADTKPVDPTLRTVDPAKETVAGQLDTLLKSGSPYLTQARTGAADTANSRGLINSSMAAGAGEAAAIGAATPIASADANTYSAASAANQAVKNSADQFNAAAVNASNTGTAAAANTATQQTLKGGQATVLAQIEAQYKELLQTSASASAVFSQTSTNLATILNDPNTSDEQKQAAVDKQTSLLNSAMSVIGSISNVDLQGLLDF